MRGFVFGALCSALHLHTVACSEGGCTDDPTGVLAGFGMGCAAIVPFGCDTDLHGMSAAVPVGSLVKLVCPASCDACGGAPSAGGGGCAAGQSANRNSGRAERPPWPSDSLGFQPTSH
jgi:hypothetical protein